MDSDGDLDLVTSVSQPGPVDTVTTYWHENTDGKGTFGPQQTIASGHVGGSFFDIDSDGDQDFVSTIYTFTPFETSYTGWFENIGQQSFAAVVRMGSGRPLFAANLDGDAELEFVSYGLWYDNGISEVDGQPVLASQYPIAAGVSPVAAVDLDGDGDNDILGRRSVMGTKRSQVVWCENTDGFGNFGPIHVIATDLFSAPHSLQAVDFDGDLDLDIMAVGQEFTAWYENRLIGDVDDNGIFDSSDLIAVLKAGKYEDGIAQNASFEEGDWDGNGEFDSHDMIIAVAANHYEKTRRPVAGPLATIDWLFSRDASG